MPIGAAHDCRGALAARLEVALAVHPQRALARAPSDMRAGGCSALLLRSRQTVAELERGETAAAVLDSLVDVEGAIPGIGAVERSGLVADDGHLDDAVDRVDLRAVRRDDGIVQRLERLARRNVSDGAADEREHHGLAELR